MFTIQYDTTLAFNMQSITWNQRENLTKNELKINRWAWYVWYSLL